MSIKRRLFPDRQTGPSFSGLGSRVFGVALLAFLSGALFYAHVDAWVGGLPLWLFTALVYSCAYGVSAVVIFNLLPRLGPFVELMAVARFMVALVASQDAGIAAQLIAAPILNATLVVVLALLLRQLVRTVPVLRTGFARPALR